MNTKPKFDVNLHFNREFGIVRTTFLKGNRRTGVYHWCSTEQLSKGNVTAINARLSRNQKLRKYAINSDVVTAVKTVFKYRPFAKISLKRAKQLQPA